MGTDRDNIDVHGNYIGGPSQVSGTQHNYFTAGPAAPPPPSTWMTTEQADPLAFGVHRPRQREGQAVLQPYVRRDVDARVRPLVAQLRRTGGILVLTGDSTAGKTRCAFEAMRRELAGCRVWAPPRHADLRGLADMVLPPAEGWVLWLDDLEDYIRDNGLEPALLSGLVRRRIIVLATLRDEYIDRYQRRNSHLTAIEQPHPFAAHLGARVLNMAEQVPLARLWSRDELRRTEQTDDPGLAEALTHHGAYGISEYLAAGPSLLDEMNRACRVGGNPRGYSFVRAAIELARAGLFEIPLTAIEELHTKYLEHLPGVRPEPAAEAFTWATRVHYGATGMLNPVGVDSVAWKPFDYLIEHFAREDLPVHRATWGIVRKHVHVGFHLHIVGLLAAAFNEDGIAEEIWSPLAEAGNSDSCFRLGLLRGRQGNHAECEALLSRAADLGHEDAPYGLGLLLRDRGRVQECEIQWQRAAYDGNAQAAYSLSALLHSQGRETEAEMWLRSAAENGDGEALYTLGLLLAKRKQYRQAELWLWEASRKHIEESDDLLDAVIRLRETNRDVEELRQEAEMGSSDAAFALGEILKSLDETKKAEVWWRRAAHAGHPEATLRYGFVLSVLHGDHRGGEPWLRMAANAGSVEATYWLGLNLGMQQRMRESQQLITRAAQAGHPAAIEHLEGLTSR
ncbi:sel1 repeat family protein [Streptomyces sp. BV333]|uniref:tetratricopeptide repeat protein n=1 Tax=Streptomyces sp. BV333 TaxID=2849673 RepID=UPI001C2E041E|nr:tetratricopeptide repeat protein [Streptomyces sp. BV333]MBV1957732.1 sel1 repeat family protein [Streptomyces sp. BV333]